MSEFHKIPIIFFFSGEACALCNLGNCHSSRGEFSQAVPFYENYLMLSQELNDIGMVPHQMQIRTIFGHKHFKRKNSTTKYIDSHLESNLYFKVA